MYIVVKKVVRPNTGIEFISVLHESIDPQVRQHFVDTYKTPGKCLNVNLNYSTNRLELTSTMYWNSKNSYLEFMQDPILQTGLFNVMHSYMNENGMQYIVFSETET